MKISEIVNTIMFDYLSLSTGEIEQMCQVLQPKMLRWLGAHHPDNKTRKIFFGLTNIAIGKDTVINQNFIVSDNYEPLLKIGERVAISPNVTIVCASAPNNSNLANNPYVKDTLIVEKEVLIGDDVWIGAGAIILPGVVIGNKSIIGAGAVVSKNVAENSIFAGVPAILKNKINI